jgi:hypothetical protein
LQDTGEQLSAQTAGNLWQFEPSVDGVTGLINSAEYNVQTTLSGTPVMLMTRVQPPGINHPMILNPFATNTVNVTQIHSWWYEVIAWIDPAQKNSDPPHGYLSVVNKSSQRLCSSLTLCNRLS